MWWTVAKLVGETWKIGLIFKPSVNEYGVNDTENGLGVKLCCECVR